MRPMLMVSFPVMNAAHYWRAETSVPFIATNAHDRLTISRHPNMRTDTMDACDELVERSLPFLHEVKDMTPGPDVERWLNDKYGVKSELYQDLADRVKVGVKQGWAANVEIGGAAYRRSRIAEPSARTFHFSVTAVYMDSGVPGHTDGCLRGQFHGHPYGEFNLVVPITPGAAMNGPNGWCTGGWTAPAPGSQHHPEARGGAVIALFFLPAGRICYLPSPQE